MDNLVSAYSAFARHGNVSPLRFTQSDPLINKPFISDGSAWITRQMLINSNLLAYKTGTSYGYRDAWAIGINPRYLIGIWVGRPDGTPVVGQYGSMSAMPILQQVNSILLNRESRLNHPLLTYEKPESVSSAKICWPSGQPLPESDANCHRQKTAWVLNNMLPPTLSTYSELKNNIYRSGWINIWVNDRGERVAADCIGAQKKQIALWPISLENWLLTKERRQSLLPPIDKKCPVMGKDIFASLNIVGLRDKQLVRALPGNNQVTIDLIPEGGFGEKWWFLDGTLVANSKDNEKVALTVTKNGKHRLLVLDESGQIVRINFMSD